MPIEHNLDYLRSLLKELCSLPNETEWVEFKHNNADPNMIGERISALSNSAALIGKQAGYLVWGIEDGTHQVVGTDFKPSTAKHKQQELESWLLQKISPKIDFSFYEFNTESSLSVVLLEIQAASHTPVQFNGIEKIRIGSYTKSLRETPEKERQLWRIFDTTPFEQQIAADNLSSEQILKLLDYPAYFDLLDLPLPEGRDGILEALESDYLIQSGHAGKWEITNLGAVLFAKSLDKFRHLSRKAVRLIQYKGNNRVETLKEISGVKGYAVGFEGLVDYLKNLLPSNEEIGKAFRKEVPMYPEIAIRELVANAIIHQDFTITGTGPTIEIFSNRMEITNPGMPLVDINRFLDSPPRSRNEALASFMRRIRICEERGSGVDKVVFQTELYQLPAPIFETYENHTRSVLFAHKTLNEMDKEERTRACYLHCCLKYVNREHMNNSSVRERFGILEHNKSKATEIINDALKTELIRIYDPNVGAKSRRYVPFWA